jgi:hypothetical protein
MTASLLHFLVFFFKIFQYWHFVPIYINKLKNFIVVSICLTGASRRL